MSHFITGYGSNNRLTGRRTSFNANATVHIDPVDFNQTNLDDVDITVLKNNLAKYAKILWNPEYLRVNAKSGDLLKRGNFYKRWQSRFCVLTKNGLLFYFKKNGSQVSPAGVLIIDSESSIEDVSKSTMMLGNCAYSFTLKIPRSCNVEGSVTKVFSERIYYFGTQDEAGFQEWWSCIASQIKGFGGLKKSLLNHSDSLHSSKKDLEEDSYSTYLKAMSSSVKNSICSSEDDSDEYRNASDPISLSSPSNYNNGVAAILKKTDQFQSIPYSASKNTSNQDLTSKSLELIADDLLKKAFGKLKIQTSSSFLDNNASSNSDLSNFESSISGQRACDPCYETMENPNLDFDFVKCHLDRTNYINSLSSDVTVKLDSVLKSLVRSCSPENIFIADAVESVIEFVPIVKEYVFNLHETVFIGSLFHNSLFLESCKDQLLVIADQIKDCTLSCITLIRHVDSLSQHHVIPTSNLCDIKAILNDIFEKCSAFSANLNRFHRHLRDVMIVDDLFRHMDQKIVQMLCNSVLISGIGPLSDLPNSVIRGLSNNLKSYGRILYIVVTDCADICESMYAEPGSLIQVFSLHMQSLLSAIKTLLGTQPEINKDLGKEKEQHCDYLTCTSTLDNEFASLSAIEKVQSFLSITENIMSDWIDGNEKLFQDKKPRILSLEEQIDCTLGVFELAVKVIDIICAIEGILRDSSVEYTKIGNGLLRSLLLSKHSQSYLEDTFRRKTMNEASAMQSPKETSREKIIPVSNRRKSCTSSSAVSDSCESNIMTLGYSSRLSASLTKNKDSYEFGENEGSGEDPLVTLKSSNSMDFVKCLSISTFLEENNTKGNDILINRVICKSLMDLVDSVSLNTLELYGIWHNCNLVEVNRDELIDQMSNILCLCQQIDEESKSFEWSHVRSGKTARQFEERRKNLFLAVSTLSISLKSVLLGGNAPPDAFLQAEKEAENVKKHCQIILESLNQAFESLSTSEYVKPVGKESPMEKVDDYSDSSPSDDYDNQSDDDVSLVENLIKQEFHQSRTVNIVFQEKTGNESHGVRPVIKGGTLSSLLEVMTCERKPDPNVISTLLLVYGTFTTASKFLNMLISRYRVDAPLDLTEKQKYIYRKKKVIPIRLRVLNVLKMWVKSYYEEFHENDDSLLDQLYDFIKELRLDFRKGTEDFEMLLEKMSRKFRKSSRGDKEMTSPTTTTTATLITSSPSISTEPSNQKFTRTVSTNSISIDYYLNSPPAPILPKDEREWNNILSINAVELARQWTLLDWEFFVAIKPKEFLDQGWNNKKQSKSGNILGMINHANQVVYWLATEIITVSHTKNRANLIKHLISTAEKCRIINNFNTLKSILAALNMSSINRLKKTWEMVPQKWRNTYLALNELMSESKSYKLYRQALQCSEGPCIPFLGVYLTNLVFVEVGNKTFLESPLENSKDSVINFDKQSRISKIIGEIVSYQRNSYNFQSVSQIQKALDRAKIFTEEEIYSQSLLIEPRPASIGHPLSLVESPRSIK